MVEAHPGIQISGNDRCVLRDLAKRYLDLCQSEENRRRISFWRSFNSLEKCRPAVFVDLNYATHMDEQIDEVLPAPRVEEPTLRNVENWFQRRLWQARIPDDRVFSPWFPVRAVMEHSGAGEWGVALDCVRDTHGGPGWRCNAVIRHPEDLNRLKSTPHKVIDADPPLARMLRDVFDEILPVHVDRSSIYSSWGGYDLSTAAGSLLGLEEMLLALYEAPGMVHGLMAFMRDSVIDNFSQCESEGDWSTAESNNYAVPPHNRELPDPECNSHGAPMKDLQIFMHGQEFETVSPSQHEEFLLEYQMPIMALFGMVNYGCCDSLHTKIGMLRRIPNLRKVLAGPIADIERIVQEVGDDYIISWRPNPAEMVSGGFEPAKVRKKIRETLLLAEGCSIEINLKELLTVDHDMNRVVGWAGIAMEEALRLS